MSDGTAALFAEQPEKIVLTVMLSLTGGEQVKGEIPLTRIQKLHDFLNRPEPFIEFLTQDGRTMAIAKQSIASAILIEMPRTDQLARSTMTADPYRTLGVGQDASAAVIRSAYLAKVKLYHPDQFSGNPLPKEVADYLQAMFVHVQAAYEELSAGPAKKDTRQAADA